MLRQYPIQFYIIWVGYKKFFLARQILKFILQERVQGKPPNPSNPCSLHSAWPLKQPRINFLKTYPRVGEYKNPSHGYNLIMHGASIFSFWLYVWSDTFRNQKAELWVEQFAARSGLNVRTFFTEKHLWPIKHISEYISMFSEGINSSLSVRKLFSSSKLHITWRNSCNFRDNPHCEGE